MEKDDEEVSSVAETDADDPSSGFIRFEVNISDITSKGIDSPAVEVNEIIWRISARKDRKTSSLEVYLSNEYSDCNIWSVDVDFTVTVLNIGDAGDPFFINDNARYNHEDKSWGDEIIKWDDLINEEKGFIKDNKIIIECSFTLSNMMGIRIAPRVDFTASDDPRHDIALVIGREKIYVSKQYLSLHSPVFNAMFYGEFDEKRKNEIELYDVERKEFIDMLNVIYPSCAKITDTNAEYLLKLGDRFLIKMVIDKVEQFLITSSRLTVPHKLKLSDQFRLVKLQEHCLNTFKTVVDIKKMEGTEGYMALSHLAKSALMDKVMKLNLQ